MTEPWPVPSTGEKIKYYLVGSIPEEFRAWARWDVKGPWSIVRRLGAVLLGLAIAKLIMDLRGDVDQGVWIGMLIGALVAIVVFPPLIGDLLRRRELERLEKRWAKE